jgi:hypothetical protein
LCRPTITTIQKLRDGKRLRLAVTILQHLAKKLHASRAEVGRGWSP